MLTIVLTGGGSGGHITPLLSLAHALKKKNPDCQIIYIGLKGEKLKGLEERYSAFDEVRLVPAGKFRRYYGRSVLAHLVDVKTLLLNGADFFKVLAGILSARAQLKQLKPDVVFSKGSYVAVPVGIAAHLLKIPLITHDSDAVPGLANRIIGKWAKTHAVGQPTENYNYSPESMVYTGIPVDERIKPVSITDQTTFKTELGLPADSLVLLVSGGGLGSGNVNDLMLGIAAKLMSDVSNLQILHIAGGQYQESVQAAYDQIEPAKNRVKVVGFTDEFYKYSGAADLIITRAGASTLAEFALQARACVVIPAAQLTGGHQLANVKQLQAAGAAEVVESNVTPQELLEVLLDLLKSPQKRAELATKLSKFAKPAAADELASIILESITPGVTT